MTVHFRALEVNLIESYPTNHMMHIKIDFQCLDSSTAL